MRLLITGKTRSGKSTALHLLLAHVLRCPWQQILLLDGKGVELQPYATLSPITYHGPNAIGHWANALGEIATGLEPRFAALAARGRREAAPDDPRVLIIADEVQIGCRHRQFGTTIKQHLTRICEQSAALHDVVVLTCQREQNSVPPAVRWNCNVKLRMLGVGFFHYQPDGRAPIAGRLPYSTPAETLKKIKAPLNGSADLAVDAASLIQILHADHNQEPANPARANATLYLGPTGSGKTWQLHNHPTGRSKRTIYADLGEPHRSWLTAIMNQCGAGVPPRATALQLCDMAALALRAEPTTLLLDNLDRAGIRERESIQKLIGAAAIVALAANTPETPSLERKINPFIARCKVVRIEPLSGETAKALAHKHLPTDIPKRSKTIKRIINMGQGHPATIVALSHQTKRGSLRELRHLENTPKRISLMFLLLVPLLFLLFAWRYQVDGYLLSALLMVALMLSRPFLYRSLRRQ